MAFQLKGRKWEQLVKEFLPKENSLVELEVDLKVKLKHVDRVGALLEWAQLQGYLYHRESSGAVGNRVNS